MPRPSPEDLPDPGLEPGSHVSCNVKQVFFFFFLTTSATVMLTALGISSK